MPDVQIRDLRIDDPEGNEVAAVTALAQGEGWPTFADPALLRRLAAAPGTVTLVAIRASAPAPGIIGFAHALTNGHHAYLSVVAVDSTVRGQGVGRQLVAAIFETSGVERLDLLSGPESEGFYDRLPNRQMAGYRLFPT
jgi:ribosomal protein S18 acetylase RimI-like enzyme